MLLIEQFLLLIFFLLFLFYLYIKITAPSRSTFAAKLFEDIELTTSEHITNVKPSSPSISQGDIPKIYSDSKMNDGRIFNYSHVDGTRGNDSSPSNKQKDYRGELQKSKRLYEKFFLKGTDTPNKKTQSKMDPYSTAEKKRGDEDYRSESNKSIISRNALSRSFTGQSDAFDAASKSDTSDVLNTGYIQSDQEDSKDSETGFKKKFDLFIKKLSQSSNDSDLLKKVMVSNSSSSDSVGGKNDHKDSQEQPGKSGVLYPIAQLNDEDEDEEQDKYKNDSFGFAKRKIDFSYELERFHKYSSSNSKGSSSSGK